MSHSEGVPERDRQASFAGGQSGDAASPLSDGRQSEQSSFQYGLSPILYAALGQISDLEKIPTNSTLDAFLQSDDWSEKIALWLGPRNHARNQFSKRDLMDQLDRDIAKIDGLIQEQLNAILHHRDFQKLEATWRGLCHLVNYRAEFAGTDIRIQILNVDWGELERDQENASEFDQSQFFRKVYKQGLGTAGGDPFSVLLLDFEIQHKPSKGHLFDDVTTLRRLSGTAAAALAPIFINASPRLFGLDHFAELPQSHPLESLFSKLEYRRWTQFRETEDARFVTVVLPRMLLRRPYRPEETNAMGFSYLEEILDREEFLWGGAVFAVGEVLIRNFAENGWFARIRGVTRNEISGGLVVGPASDYFPTEHHGNAPKSLVDLSINDYMERQLAKQGLMALCPCRDTPFAAFFSSPSIQSPAKYSSEEATANAELSAMTNYLLCASRFGHFIRLIHREKIGSNQTAEQLQRFLTDWLVDYVEQMYDPQDKTTAKKPLKSGGVRVSPRLGNPGEYDCSVFLQLIHEFDNIAATLKLDAKLTDSKNVRSS